MRRIQGMFFGTLWLMACEANTPRNEALASTSAPLLVAHPLGQVPHRPAIPIAIRAQLRAAALRLTDLQADQIGDNAGNGLDDSDPDDGGWDWTLPVDAASHSSAASPDNLYGAVGLGALATLRAGVDTPRLRSALLDAGLGMQHNAEIDSAPDMVYLTLLAEVSDNPGFSELARARYDALCAAAGGAQAVGERERDERHAAGEDGLIAYDLAWRTLGAAALDAVFSGAGYDADADSFAQLVVADLSSASPLFDSSDAQENFYVHGLAWSLVALSRTGDPLAATRTRLLEVQHADGAWPWNAAYPDDNIQATAHATAALALASGSGLSGWTAALRGAGWLLRQQAADGGWKLPSGLENPQVDADAMLAIYLVASGWTSDDTGLRAETNDAVVATTASLSAAIGNDVTPPVAAPNAH
jgi:hypothetical protein